MIELTSKEQDKLILAFEEEVSTCICDMLEKISKDEESENYKIIFEKLDKYCEENRINEKSCINCFKTFFSLFKDERKIDI